MSMSGFPRSTSTSTTSAGPARHARLSQPRRTQLLDRGNDQRVQRTGARPRHVGIAGPGAVLQSEGLCPRTGARWQARGRTRNLVGGVLASGLGERELARGLSLKAEALFRELGDQARLQNVLVGMTFEHMMYGDIASAERTLRELAGAEYRDANDTIRAWRLCARTAIDTIRGEIDEAMLSELSSVAEAKQAPADRLLCLGVLASAHERRGERELARAFAERGLDVLRSCRVVWSAYGVYGATGVVGTLVAEWERAAAARSYDGAAQARARSASQMFYRAARSSPMCRPAALLYRGSTFFLSGNIRRAMKDWRSAVHCAGDLHMQYFLGLAWFQIAKSSEINDASRELALSRAEQAFKAVGATVDLLNVRLASIQFTKNV